LKQSIGLSLFALPFLVLGGWGCATSRPPGVSPDLTLSPQSETRFQCGPTTLSSVLAFYGVTLEEAKISDAIYSPTAKGVLLTDLSRIAREQGFETRIRTGTLDDLSEAVNDRNPPIVLLDLGLASYHIPHFTAVTGVADSGVFFLGSEPDADFLSTSHFERQWKKSGNQFLVLLPPSASSQ
jgi:predicted double-glycine peptidase